MGGYALTEMNEYEMNDSLERYFREITGKEDVPVKILLCRSTIDPRSGTLRGIALYEGMTYNFMRLNPKQAREAMVKADLSKNTATIRESYNMTIVRSNTLQPGMVYEPF